MLFGDMLLWLLRRSGRHGCGALPESSAADEDDDEEAGDRDNGDARKKCARDSGITAHVNSTSSGSHSGDAAGDWAFPSSSQSPKAPHGAAGATQPSFRRASAAILAARSPQQSPGPSSEPPMGTAAVTAGVLSPVAPSSPGWCRLCHKLGHAQTDCTEQCWKCFSKEHGGRECREVVCFYCKQSGHMCGECPTPDCKICNESGHSQEQCRSPGRNAASASFTDIGQRSDRTDTEAEHLSAVTSTELRLVSSVTRIVPW